jgi:glycosyltransferase involved in cell wall biosynthesis
LKKDLDVLFLGGLFPRENEEEILEFSKGNIQNAANNLQWGIVEGLDDNLEKPIKILNSLYIGSFPKRYKKLSVNTFTFSHSKGTQDVNVGFLNLAGIKHISKYFSLRPHLKKWAESNNGKEKVIIAYAMTSTFTRLLKYVKKVNNSVVTCLIIPDLPQYMDLSKNENKLYSILKNIEMKIMCNDIEYIDKYVLLTEYMKESLHLQKSYVVMEGIASDKFRNIADYKEKSSLKMILYSGTLNERYGVLNLIDAFKRIKSENYKLVICGAGDCEKRIQIESENDKRIIYLGQLKHEEVLKLQKEATVLVNPRQNNEEYTKFSFPSKLLEYMSSGTPVIAYKLDGIPDEYDQFLYYVEDNSVEALKTKIVQICRMNNESTRLTGERARRFVLSEKNKTIQGKKIIDLVIN